MNAKRPSVGNLVIGSLSLLFGFVSFFQITARDPTGWIGVLFVTYAVALLSPPSTTSPLRLCGAVFTGWGGLHLLAGILALTGSAFASGLPQWQMTKALYLGALWTAFGISILRRDSWAKGRGWPLLAILQGGLTLGAVLLLIPAIAFTRRVRTSSLVKPNVGATA